MFHDELFFYDKNGSGSWRTTPSIFWKDFTKKPQSTAEMAAVQPSPTALQHLRQNVEILTRELSNVRTPIQFKEIVFNLKAWEPGRDALMEKWFRHSKSKLIRATPRIKCALEELGTLEGKYYTVAVIMRNSNLFS